MDSKYENNMYVKHRPNFLRESTAIHAAYGEFQVRKSTRMMQSWQERGM